MFVTLLYCVNGGLLEGQLERRETKGIRFTDWEICIFLNDENSFNILLLPQGLCTSSSLCLDYSSLFLLLSDLCSNFREIDLWRLCLKRCPYLSSPDCFPCLFLQSTYQLLKSAGLIVFLSVSCVSFYDVDAMKSGGFVFFF